MKEMYLAGIRYGSLCMEKLFVLRKTKKNYILSGSEGVPGFGRIFVPSRISVNSPVGKTYLEALVKLLDLTKSRIELLDTQLLHAKDEYYNISEAIVAYKNQEEG